MNNLVKENELTNRSHYKICNLGLINTSLLISTRKVITVKALALLV